jgi:hypothetical protein
LPSLQITASDFAYIRSAVKEASPKEIGGLGVVVVEDGVPIIRHMRLLKQKISSSEVDWGDLGEAHSEYLTWLYTPVEDGGAGFDGESYGIYSWHSHGSMGVFWSGTDEHFISGVGTSVPWVFSSVYNNKGESKHRLDVFPRTSTLGCELLDGVTDERTQISWKGDNVKLWILYEDPVSEELEALELALDLQIDAVKKEAEEKIAKLEAEAAEVLKPMKGLLRETQEAVAKEAEERLKEDFKKYVEVPKPGYTIHSSRTNGSSKGSGAKSDPKETKGASTSLVKTGGSEGVKKGLEAINRHFRCYNIETKEYGWRAVKSIVLDERLILCEEPPMEFLNQIDHEIAVILNERERYNDYIERVQDQIREESQR